MRYALLLFVPLVSAAPAAAQAAPFDAASVVFDERSSVRTMLDLNGDGRDDFVGFWNTGGTINGYVHDGAQGFRRAFSLSETLNPTLGGWEMLRGRFDGDQLDDFALLIGWELRVWLSAGAETPVLTWMSTEQFSESLAVLDFDGDGLDDLVVGTIPGMTVYHNTGEGFELAATTTTAAIEIHAFDHDGDGRDDIVSRIGSRFELWTINSEGVPTQGSTILHGIHRPSGEAKPVFGDIDGDGDEDIVVFGMWGEYGVVRRTGPASLVAEPRRLGGPATHLADIDGDGDLDGVCCGGGGTGSTANIFPSTYHISHNDGSGGFGAAMTVAGLGASRLAGASDVDGDGRLDLIAGRTVLFNREGFAREVQPRLSVPSSAYGYSFHDPDRDGDPDLVPEYAQFSFLSSIYANDGTGQFTFRLEVLPPAPSSTTWTMPGYRGDFDGDGDDDLIVAGALGAPFDTMRLLANQGGGSYGDAGPATAPGLSFAPDLTATTVGPRVIRFDADNDGDLDLIPSYSPTWVWLNDGGGYFTRGQQLAVRDVVGHADFNGDGAADLVLFVQSALEVWFGDGQGAFVQAVVQPVGVTPTATIAIGDVDTDGDPDIVWPEPFRAQMLRNLGGGTLALEAITAPRLHNNNFYGLHAHILDVDADGYQDLMLFPVREAAASTAILLGDGEGGWHPPIVQYFEPEAVVDVDSDGDVDVVRSDLLVRNALFGLEAGHRIQYGQSGSGLGGVAPTFGSTGPVRVETPMTVRVTGMPGGATLVYVLGTSPADLPDFPLPGVHTLVYPWLSAVVLTASGTPGEVGTGAFEYTYSLPSSAAGLSLFKQAFVLDPSLPSLINYTNGLEIRYGKAR